jgi:RNA polymerase sigma-70 factor, ECF subfamily
VCHTFERNAVKQEPLATQKFTGAQVQSLYEKHGPALAAYACCRGLDFAAAEDVVQQFFLKLLGTTMTEMQFPLAYAHRAVRNAALNLQRDRRRETQLPEDELWWIHAGARREEIIALQEALEELPPEQQETVFMRIWSGMTLQEIADETKTPLNTVASRYRYALEKLRMRLK